MLEIEKFKTEKKFKNYNITKDDQIKVSYIESRFKDMQQARTVVEKNWDTYQTMIDAIYVPYPDERSSSVVPLASSLIEQYVGEATKIKTEFQFKSETSDHKTNAKALEYVWKYDRRRNKRKQAFIDNEYITAGFGTSIIYTGYESYNKSQKDPIIGDDMSLTWETKIIDKSNIIVKNVDIRQFYIDNQVIDNIDQASDCIYIQWIGFDKFQDYKTNPLYKNIDKIQPREYSNEYKAFVTQEDQVKKGDFVKLTHYWNVDKDMYCIVANGILIREHPMISTINGEKALPFVIRTLGKKNYSIYGRGICEALMMFNSEVNNLRELLMDSIRRSNTQVLALGNGLNFDGRTFSYDNEILTFDGNLANNFEQISGNGPNQAIFNYLDRLYKDIAVYIGIDIQNIVGEPQQTAFQTEVQREASQKRINVRLTNRDLAFERFADLYKDLLQKYFPKKTAEGLYPIIEIEGEEMVGEGDKKKFRKKKGTSTFEVTPEVLRGDIYVDVHTNTTAPTINAVDRAQKVELLNTIGTIAQGYAIAKQSGVDIETILPIKQTLKDLASDYNLNVDQGSDMGDVKEEKKKLNQDIQNMMVKPGMGGLTGGEQLPTETPLPTNIQQ